MNKIQKITHRLTLESGVEIMFIVKNQNVLYCNQYADTLFLSGEKDYLTLDGRVAKIVYKGLFSRVEVFVAFDEQESYTLFTANIERDKRLHYVALEVINYIDKYKINKQLKFSLGIHITCYSAYKLFKRNNKYYMVNNSRNDAFIITENSYKNSENIDTLIEEFFYSKDYIAESILDNQSKQEKIIFDYTIQLINKYGIDKVSSVYAAIVDNTFSNNMQLKLKQMVQFLREEADAARLSDIVEVRNFGLELFENEKMFINALNDEYKYGIDDDNGPQETITTTIFPLLMSNHKLTVELRINIDRYLAYFYNIYVMICKKHNPTSFEECLTILFTQYPEEATVIKETVILLNLFTSDINNTKQ